MKTSTTKKSDHFYCTKKSAKKKRARTFLHTISSTKKIVRNVLSLSAVGQLVRFFSKMTTSGALPPVESARVSDMKSALLGGVIACRAKMPPVLFLEPNFDRIC
jgi:hypothetical protein